MPPKIECLDPRGAFKAPTFSGKRDDFEAWVFQMESYAGLLGWERYLNAVSTMQGELDEDLIEDEQKEVMNASMDVKRKANESITTWLCRVQQAWMIAENNQICTNPDSTKIWLLEQGARLSPSQAQQFNTLMTDHENDLRRAEKAYLVVDRVAERDGKTSQTFIMEDSTSNVNDEAEDVTNVFICLSDFGLAPF